MTLWATETTARIGDDLGAIELNGDDVDLSLRDTRLAPPILEMLREIGVFTLWS